MLGVAAYYGNVSGNVGGRVGGGETDAMPPEDLPEQMPEEPYSEVGEDVLPGDTVYPPDKPLGLIAGAYTDQSLSPLERELVKAQIQAWSEEIRIDLYDRLQMYQVPHRLIENAVSLSDMFPDNGGKAGSGLYIQTVIHPTIGKVDLFLTATHLMHNQSGEANKLFIAQPQLGRWSYYSSADGPSKNGGPPQGPYGLVQFRSPQFCFASEGDITIIAIANGGFDVLPGTTPAASALRAFGFANIDTEHPVMAGGQYVALSFPTIFRDDIEDNGPDTPVGTQDNGTAAVSHGQNIGAYTPEAGEAKLLFDWIPFGGSSGAIIVDLQTGMAVGILEETWPVNGEFRTGVTPFVGKNLWGLAQVAIEKLAAGCAGAAAPTP